MISPFPSQFFIVRPVLAVRPPSVTDYLRGRYHITSDYGNAVSNFKKYSNMSYPEMV